VQDVNPTSKDALLRKIDKAIASVEPMAQAKFPPAQSILRQLLWCRSTVVGQQTEAKPGPLSMNLISTREFDMYGDNPDLATLINEIQNEIEARAR
jgi:hypothetical protein